MTRAAHGGVRESRAFTLIELMVSLGVLAILIGIFVPGLMGARNRAKETVVIANLRSVGVAFTSYTETYQGAYPWAAPGQLLPLHGGTSTIGDGSRFALSYMWPTLMHRVAPWPEHYGAWVSERIPGVPAWQTGEGEGTIRWPDYRYCRSFQGRPELWPSDAGGAPMLDPMEFYRPTRTSDVLFPSSKVLAFDEERVYLRRPPEANDPRGVVLADGSASLRHDRDATPPVENRLTAHAPTVYHDTPGGVHGRDF